MPHSVLMKHQSHAHNTMPNPEEGLIKAGLSSSLMNAMSNHPAGLSAWCWAQVHTPLQGKLTGDQ